LPSCLFSIIFLQGSILVDQEADFLFAMLKKGLEASQIEWQRNSTNKRLYDNWQLWV